MKTKTLVMFLFISIVFVACSPATQPTPIAIPTSLWKTYNSKSLLVTFDYEGDWIIDETGYAANGQDGFFSISAVGVGFPSAKENCDNEILVNASGKGGNRYGTKPSLEILQVDNQPACLIMSSDDQPQDKEGVSLLVVEYPVLDQGHVRLLQIFADKNHIRGFISTLKFIR